jgi:chorismate dehydratase
MRYALISFLNARPLWWGLTHHPRPDDSFVFASPARCADLVAGGKASLALIPAIELARIPDAVAMPDICIASMTEVRSVLLVSRKPFEEIRSVALDPSSRTSVALARILLGERLGREVYETIKFDSVERAALLAFEGHDAAVVIGDRALQLSRELPDDVTWRYDLVSEWHRLFGEPFVFALWAGRRSVLAADSSGRSIESLRRQLRESLELGRASIETIARESSEELSLPYAELLEYFRLALHYDFGQKERDALERFYRLAVEYRLIDEEKSIEWLIDPEFKRS